MKLTKSSVGALQLPRDKADAIYFDDDLPGFGVRLRAGGRRTWIVQFRVGARQRRLTIGNVAALDAAEARIGLDLVTIRRPTRPRLERRQP